MSRLDQWIDNKLVQNIAIWLFLFLILSVSVHTDNVLLFALGIMLFLSAPVYINNLKILPLFFAKQQALASVLFLLNVSVFTFLGVLLTNGGLQNVEWRLVYNLFGILILALFFSSSIKIARDSFQRRHEEKEAELKLLKAQLNPHFLFNTLNNLYGLSVIKSDKLPNLMLKLSELLRYSLYDTKDTFVALEKEIKYLENYIALEKIRLEDHTDIQLHISGELDAKTIAPMLLIVFVENAFKHLGAKDGSLSEVSIDITVEGDELSFKCINSVDALNLKKDDMEKGKSGIGLANAKKRLELMYPNNYELLTTCDAKQYVVDLNIGLELSKKN